MNENGVELEVWTLNQAFIKSAKFGDLSYEDENLRIDSLEGRGTFIVSIHSPTSQIWLSSPISGAHHFESKSSTESVEWISTRDTNISLKQLIIEELDAE